MTKTRAYTSRCGNEMVTAKQVGQLRNLKFNGQPTGFDYFSTHKPGKRRPVKHVMRERWFFAYIESGDGESLEDGGESLNHMLFKEALCSLEHTTLSLHRPTTGKPKKWRDVPITITHSEMEKPIPRSAGEPYRADVYIEFETADTLGVKWEGGLFLEVRYKHPVDAVKQTELRKLGVPVVEVEIPDLFVIKFDEDDTDDEREEAHRRFIKRVLESEKGFLNATILSDPSSKKYLERVVAAQSQRILKLEQSEEQLSENLMLAEGRLAAAVNEDLKQGLDIQVANVELRDARSKLISEEADLNQYRELQVSLEEQVSNLVASLWRLRALCALLGFVTSALTYWKFFI